MRNLYGQRLCGQTLYKRAAIIALLVAALATASGCTTSGPSGATPNPTAQPMPTATALATEMPAATSTAGPSAQATAATLSITVDGNTLAQKGVDKDGTAWLPLKEVAEALGFEVQESETGSGSAKGVQLTISPKNKESGEPVKVSYQVNGNAIAEASVTRTGMTQTLADPLMMMDGTLYAAEKVFTEALNAKVTYDAPSGKVTVAKGTITS